MKFLNKFLKNKNTVTILGVLACLVILFVGYNIRINQKTALVTVYYAKDTIQPKTLITEEMVGRTQVPESFIMGSYYKKYDDIVGKYSNYNTMIAKGSIFYYDLLVEESSLPDAVLYSVNEGERVVSFPVDTELTYGNSFMPGNIVDVYVKLVSGGKVVYGEYLENIEILGVKDKNGRNVFENTEEEREPAFMYFSLPEAKYLLFTSMKYLKTYDEKNAKTAQIEIVFVPNTQKFETDELLASEVSSTYLYDYVLKGIEQIDGQKELYNQLKNEMDQLALEKKNKKTNTSTQTNTTTSTTTSTNNTTNR